MIEQKVGNVVKLVSGGPDMTIAAVGDGDKDGQVRCQWFNAGAELQEAWYPAVALIPAPQVGES
jgi:uncharacterized protein YodC (DUF2158 family)